ncbi:GntR family transcriptional regulator [Salipiger sp.]|uniref:GntR family transcriptional regulator n=1 Tax=Salipiger sp. TaxID=2078585 RepID=UPI003A970081
MTMESKAFRALDPAIPISPQISRFLRESIIRNELQPGNRISEAEIARECSVSRQPVREAFIKLSEQGLLSVLPQRGTVITKISYTAVLDARFLREAIESDIVKILASRPDAALVRDLRDQIAAQETVGHSDRMEFILLDERFHRTLADAAGKGGAWKQIEGLKSQMDRVRFLSLSQFPVGNLVTQHALLVDQIEAGDMPAAESAIRLHLREILKDLPHVLAANPDFFDLPAGKIPEPVNVPISGGE